MIFTVVHSVTLTNLMDFTVHIFTTSTPKQRGVCDLLFKCCLQIITKFRYKCIKKMHEAEN